MTKTCEGPPRWGSADGPEVVSLEENASNVGPKTAPAQENLLLEAIKALSAQEICADTLENIPIMLAASGWRATAALLTHAAGCAEAGDFLNAERNRRLAREQLNAATGDFRKFQEAMAAAAEGPSFVAEAFRL